MKRKLLWAVGLVLTFVLMLLVTAPATLLTRTASQFVPALAFSGVQGSFWRGEAALLRFGDSTIEQLQWQLSPWRLLLGQAAVRFEFGAGTAQQGSGALLASFSGAISASDVSLQLPAQALQPLVRMPGVGFAGDLQLQLADLAYADGRIERLQGRLIWLQAQVRTPLGQPRLGAYAVDLGGDGEGGINGDITDIDGVLGLNGRFHVTPNGLELEGSVRSDLPEELDRFFRVIGRPEGDRYSIRWQQSFAR